MDRLSLNGEETGCRRIVLTEPGVYANMKSERISFSEECKRIKKTAR